ncbi:unnamed protein product [Hymenolepis diminuta]|uniref:Metallo-beta-lactamase domain-containing protein n=1 Tax=Hymenolepis diminuta TaxID=6216 RepID=A0A564Z0C5_HYMDI|nr:unnamed protein product [Hymenolepis diminuta]
MGTPYPQLPNVSVVHPNVTRVLGQNPGMMTLQGTNSYLVGSETGPRILIDTTGGEISTINQYVSVLKAILEPKDGFSHKPEPPVSELLLTHWHPDHTEGIEAVQKLIKSLTPSKPDFHLEAYKSPEGPDLKSIGYYDGPLNMLNESMTFSPPGTPSIRLKPIFTPGHSVDHMCFAMYVNDIVECVFVGDLLLVWWQKKLSNLDLISQHSSQEKSISAVDQSVHQVCADGYRIHHLSLRRRVC